MRNLPKRPARNVPEQQKRRLLRWLEAWEEHQAFAAIEFEPSEGSGGSIDPERLASLIEPFDSQLVEGQIRLMPAHGEEEPLLLLLIKPWNEADYLVAPFTAIGEPATPTELKLRDHMLYSSLCLWNTRTLPRTLLSESWVVDECDESEMADVHAILEVAMLGSDVPEHLLEKTGAPIFRSEDPRIDYQDQYLRAFGVWIASVPSTKQPAGELFTLHFSAPSPDALAASSGRTEFIKEENWFESDPRTHSVVFFPHQDGEHLECNLYKLGVADTRSSEFDGYVLQFKSGERSAPIEDGRVVFKRSSGLEDICFTGPNGETIRLAPKGD